MKKKEISEEVNLLQKILEILKDETPNIEKNFKFKVMAAVDCLPLIKEAYISIQNTLKKGKTQ